MSRPDKLRAAIADIEPRWSSASGNSRPRAARSRPPVSASARRSTRDDARAGLLHRDRELLAPPVAAGGRHPAVDAARLLPAGWLLVVDESHMTIRRSRHVQERPDAQGDFGRLRFPAAAALDNRPLTFEEFQTSVHQAVYMSATPGPYEWSGASAWSNSHPPDRCRRPAYPGPPDQGPDRRLLERSASASTGASGHS